MNLGADQVLQFIQYLRSSGSSAITPTTNVPLWLKVVTARLYSISLWSVPNRRQTPFKYALGKVLHTFP